MARSHVVTIAVGTGADAVEVTAWDEVTITLDMLRPGSPWTLTLWRTGRGAAWARVRAAAKIFAPVEVRIDGAVQLRGLIEKLRDGAGRAGAPFTIGGRDLLGAAMVSDVDPRLHLRNTTLAEAISEALSPLGVDVVIGAEADEVREIQAGARPGARRSSTRARRRQRVDRFRPQVGQRVWDFLQQLARRHGYLIYPGPIDDGMGLVIDRPAYDAPAQGALLRRLRPDGTYAGNILDGALALDGTDVPTSVTVFGRTGLSVPQDVRHQVVRHNVRLQQASLGLFGEVDALLGRPSTFDATTTETITTRVPRGPVQNTRIASATRVQSPLPNRPRYIRDTRARTPQIAEQRGRHVIARAMQDFAAYEAVVQGFAWGPRERLWTMNTMVTIDDEVSGVRGNWLCTRVVFKRSRASGHTTELRLVPPGAIDLEPDAET